MPTDTEIRLGILKQVAESDTPLAWEDRHHNDIANDLLSDKCVYGELSEGGTVLIRGLRDKGSAELRAAAPLAKMRMMSKRAVVALWAFLIAAIAYVLQLDPVKERIADLIRNFTK